MPRSRMGIKERRWEKVIGGASAAQPVLGRRKPLPGSLHHAGENSLSDLEPGDLILLDQTTALRTRIEPAFYAVLACPACGALGLITPSQYFGTTPVVCGSDSCPCRFKIDDQTRLIYLPVN